MIIKDQYKEFGIDDKVLSFGQQILEELKPRFDEIDAIAEFNQLKVIKAMQDNNVAEMHLGTSTGYGYNDLGRDTLEKIYADLD